MIKISQANLRMFFVAFLLLLATPSLILSWKAYEQLRWESFHQYQLEASSLAKQIDAFLSDAIKKEEARSDTDYTFLVLAGSPEAGFLQRSDLSKYPVESQFPGVVGYFQVDEKGLFSSPLLPLQADQSALYGISPEEQVKRSQLEFSIRSILSENQLVPGELEFAQSKIQESLAASQEKAAESRRSAGASAEKVAEVESRDLKSDSFFTQPESIASDADAAQSGMFEDDAIAQFNQQPETKSVDAVKPGSLPQSLSQVGQLNELEDKRQQSKIEEQKITGSRLKKSEKSKTLNFEALQTEAVQAQISQNVGELPSYAGEQYRSRDDVSEAEKRAKEEANEKLPKRVSRLEQNYLPSPMVNQALDGEMNRKAVQINLFESELEPFRFSLLMSGHLIAYRQVWRENHRIIQGAILEAEQFFDEAIRLRYRESSLSQVASLHVAYGSKILKSYFGEDLHYSNRRKQLRGEQLYALTLSEPFNQISLVYNVTQMPVSAGAGFIIMVALALMAIVFVGTYLLYRLALKQSMLVQQQQDFVSSVSHELKTPLTSIRMYGEILKQGWMSDEKRSEYYDFIFNESERLTRLINNVLQISKVNRDMIQLDLKGVKIGELLDQVHSKTASQINQSGFSFNTDIEVGLERQSVVADADAFIQIMINLIDNAIKYSAKSKIKKIELVIRANKQSGVEFSLRDYGPGIAKDQIKKIFQIFYRSGNELTRECAGTGIGLALVKELTKAMQGTISVSNEEVGAVFTLSLPLESGQ